MLLTGSEAEFEYYISLKFWREETRGPKNKHGLPVYEFNLANS